MATSLGTTCHLVPRRPYRVSRTAGTYLSTVWAPHERVLKVGGIDQEFKEFLLDDQVDNKSVFDPSDLFDKANKYAAEIKWNPKKRHLDDAISKVRRAFAPTQKLFPLESKERIFRCLKIDKASGAPVFVRKRESFEDDWNRAREIGSGNKAPPPCVALRRTQHGEAGPKTRLVWGYPQAMTILEARYAAPLIEALMSHPNLPYRMRKVELQAWMTRIENRPFRLGLDYSGFDSTVSRTLIRVAFDILRDWFVEVDETEWSRIVSYFIYTDIIMPDRHVYRKNRGIPSGSYFTQLVGSITNMIALHYAMNVMGIELSNRNVMVMGDDSIAAPSRGFSLRRLATVLDSLGLTVNVEKSYSSYFGSRQNDRVNFLGHDWELGLPNRSMRDVLVRMTYPERWSSTAQKPDERFAAFMGDAVCTWKLWVRWTYKVNHHGCILSKLPKIRSIQFVEEVGLSKALDPGGSLLPEKRGVSLSMHGLLN